MPTSDVYVHVRFADGTSRIAGRYRLHRPDGAASFGEFAYVRSWLRNDHGRAFALDPQNLPLSDSPSATHKRLVLPGVLADATPDRWGRRLIEVVRSDSSRPTTPTDWLLATGEECVGCLAFSPTPAPPLPDPGYARCEDLARIKEGFEQLLRGERSSPLIERLYRAGRSLGGARPKAVVSHDNGLWIAKFQRQDDEFDQCAAEDAAMKLARACGIDAAPTRLESVGPRRVVLVQRFDRTNEGPPFRPTAHFLSALSALDLDETSDTGSYPGIADVIRRFGAGHVEDREELFRRMIFNVLCGNRDDHLKNHGLIRHESGGWRLSPAYDVVPQPDMEPVQAIGIGRSGGYPTLTNSLSMSGAFGLNSMEAEAIVARMIETMRPWRRMFAEWGVKDDTIRHLEPAFAVLIAAAGKAIE